MKKEVEFWEVTVSNEGFGCERLRLTVALRLAR